MVVRTKYLQKKPSVCRYTFSMNTSRILFTVFVAVTGHVSLVQSEFTFQNSDSQFVSNYDKAIIEIFKICPELIADNMPYAVDLGSTDFSSGSSDALIDVKVQMLLHKFVGINDIAQQLSLSVQFEFIWSFDSLSNCSNENLRVPLEGYKNVDGSFIIPRSFSGSTWRPNVLHRNAAKEMNPFNK